MKGSALASKCSPGTRGTDGRSGRPLGWLEGSEFKQPKVASEKKNTAWMCMDVHGYSRMRVSVSSDTAITWFISEHRSSSRQILKPESCAPGSSQVYQISEAFIGIICLMAETTIVKQYHIRAFYTKISILSQLVAVLSQCHSTMTMAGHQTWAPQYCWRYGCADLKPRSLKSHMCRWTNFSKSNVLFPFLKKIGWLFFKEACFKNGVWPSNGWTL